MNEPILVLNRIIVVVFIKVPIESRNVLIKPNRKRVVVTKPRRPRVIVQRPNYNKRGYFWRNGYWKWSVFYGTYIWVEGRWERERVGFTWTPGFWEENPSGYFWIEGYWSL